MKNVNKRIIIYLVTVAALLLFLVIETMALKSRFDRKMSGADKENTEPYEGAGSGDLFLGDAEVDQASGGQIPGSEITEDRAYETYSGADKNVLSAGDSSLQNIWREAASVYGQYQDTDAAYKKISALIDASYTGPGDDHPFYVGDIRKLYDYWDETNSSGFVNGDALPEGLPDDDSLCIVILGYALLPDGSMRDELKLRLDEGFENSKKYPNAYVLVTGGGTALGKPDIKEADKMAEYLEDKGLSPDRIIIENDSMTTAENAVFSEKLLKSEYPQVKEIAIVTSDYHVPLGCQIFQGWFIMTGSDLKVTSNSASHPGNPTTFKIRDQVFWMEELTGYLQSK